MSRPPSLRAGDRNRCYRHSLTGARPCTEGGHEEEGAEGAPGLVLDLRELLGSADLEHLAEQVDGQVPDVAWCTQG